MLGFTLMRRILESNFSVTLLLFCVAGLYVPGTEKLPTETVIWSLAGVIFLSCFRIDWAEMRRVRPRAFLFYYGLRFVALPPALYFLCGKVLPSYRLAVFLLALAPPATSSPAFATLLGGNVALAFALTVLGNLATLVVFPLSLNLVLGGSIALDTRGIFETLVLSVALPIVVFLGARRVGSVSRWVWRHGPFGSLLLIGLTFTVAIAKRRALILSDPFRMLPPLVVSSACFVVRYAFGWMIQRRHPWRDKLTYGLCSGANNISLVVSVALLYFPAEVSLFLIVAEIPWVIALWPYQRWLATGTSEALPVP